MSWLTKVRSLFSKAEETKETNNQDLSSMKLAELRAVAKERGMKGYTSLRKAQLLDRLQGD